ncbi:hypothetical protein GCM10023191_102160 [Actinoallomurus oryzae]|uniref:Uncharacterized protein n=1 Tax=Actinoallomurus oryzae TaxID=502180 RepID=A0ABP8RA34_9ACTN
MFSLRLNNDGHIAGERGELPNTYPPRPRFPHGVRWSDDPLHAYGPTPTPSDPAEPDPAPRDADDPLDLSTDHQATD